MRGRVNTIRTFKGLVADLRLINKYCKFYNYFTKEEVMWGSLYRKYPFPKDYHYYYGYFTKKNNPMQ